MNICNGISDDSWGIILEYSYNGPVRYAHRALFEMALKCYRPGFWADDVYTNSRLIKLRINGTNKGASMKNGAIKLLTRIYEEKIIRNGFMKLLSETSNDNLFVAIFMHYDNYTEQEIVDIIRSIMRSNQIVATKDELIKCPHIKLSYGCIRWFINKVYHDYPGIVLRYIHNYAIENITYRTILVGITPIFLAERERLVFNKNIIPMIRVLLDSPHAQNVLETFMKHSTERPRTILGGITENARVFMDRVYSLNYRCITEHLQRVISAEDPMMSPEKFYRDICSRALLISSKK